ncbi:dihydrolipoyllysine-residue acetyltransferase [Fontimonas sp. SYSU GA230001]|uniref:dihydrolipoyllysine-residue acetyltransferase n=1 Tax=Fontimonas sp. SYSU GA230001 TaxID=3142450 RepID=UPI0032B57ACF
MSQTLEVQVPDIGNYHDVPVIEVLVKDGDRVARDQPLVVLESDKATMEVPAPADGIVRGLQVKLGDKLSQGSPICTLEQTGIGHRESGIVEDKAAPPAAPAVTAAPQPVAHAAAPATPSNDSRSEVRIPDIGNYHDVPVIEVLVKDGDRVARDQPLVVLESDKATMEVPAPADGVVSGLALKVGDKVSQGDRVCTLTGAVETAPMSAAAKRSAAVPGATSSPVPAPAPPSLAGRTAGQTAIQGSSSASAVPYAGPATRKFARELGVDLAQVKGSGPRGRIVVEDVQAFVKQRMSQSATAAAAVQGSGIPPIPPVDFAQFGEIETRPLARIRRISAQFLHRSWVNVPHVTQFDEADITELEAFRKQQSEESAAAGGPKLTLLPFLMKAVGVALKQYPEFNASLAPDGENLILKKYCHIGFAADTPNGLVVPVVRDVWTKGIAELAADCAALAKKARDGKLKPDEMKGGCFSISSLGGIGGSHFTPIVNAPEVAILGVSRSQMKPVWDGQQFVPRLLCPLSLSYDHRVIDGAYAARFIVHLVKLLSDLRRVLL